MCVYCAVLYLALRCAQFSTLWRSFLTCFLIVMNDNSVQYTFVHLQGWAYAAAMIWWFSFTCVIVFVLLNFLIAIIVDSFMDIKVCLDETV